MLHNVVFYSGIKTKKTINIKDDIFILKEDENDSYPMYYKLFNNHLFMIDSNINNVITFEISDEILLNILNNSLENVIKNAAMLNIGLCEYLQVSTEDINVILKKRQDNINTQ